VTSRLWLALGALVVLGALALFALPGLFEPAAPGPSAAVQPTGAAEPAPAQVVEPTPRDAGVAGAAGAAGPGEAASSNDALRRKSLAWLRDALENAPQFRVRLQAATTLGRMRSAAATEALVGALSDPHPAVRRAAVSALSRRGGPGVEAALRRAEASERDGKVKQALTRALAKAAPKPAAPQPGAGGPRYYVGVGEVVGSGLSPVLLSRVDGMVRSGVQSMGGVRLAPRGESPGAASAVLSSQSRAGFFLDVRVGEVTQDGAGTAASVSVVVGSYPGRDMRAIVKGKATLPGGTGSQADRDKAVEGAVRSALRKLPPTLARLAP